MNSVRRVVDVQKKHYNFNQFKNEKYIFLAIELAVVLLVYFRLRRTVRGTPRDAIKSVAFARHKDSNKRSATDFIVVAAFRSVRLLRCDLFSFGSADR